MSQQANTLTSEDDEGPREPGVGPALLAVLVMLLATAILSGLIFVLMIAIAPLESRQPKTTVIEVPAGQTESAAQPVPQPAPQTVPQPAPQTVPQTVPPQTAR